LQYYLALIALTEVAQSQNLKEIFKTDKGGVYQCNQTNRLLIDFAGSTTAFKISCFLDLKKKLEQVDLNAMAFNLSEEFDYAIVSPCPCERCYVLSMSEVIAFRELLAGAKVMLELNSILYERLYAVAV
jgi:hypothetical protein